MKSINDQMKFEMEQLNAVTKELFVIGLVSRHNVRWSRAMREKTVVARPKLKLVKGNKVHETDTTIVPVR